MSNMQILGKRSIAAARRLSKSAIAFAAFLCSCDSPTPVRVDFSVPKISAAVAEIKDAGEALEVAPLRAVDALDGGESFSSDAADALPSCSCGFSSSAEAIVRPPQFTDLQREMRDSNPEARCDTAARLWLLAADRSAATRAEAVRILQRALGDEDESVRAKAVCALADAVVGQRELQTRNRVITQLIERLKDSSENVVLCAVEQLVRIDYGLLDERLRDEPPNPRVRRDIERALEARMFSDYDSPIARKIERAIHELWRAAHGL